jgi:hypothetical protein
VIRVAPEKVGVSYAKGGLNAMRELLLDHLNRL